MNTTETVCACGSEIVIEHEDGWQCFNCMRIIYRQKPYDKPPAKFGANHQLTGHGIFVPDGYVRRW